MSVKGSHGFSFLVCYCSDFLYIVGVSLLHLCLGLFCYVHEGFGLPEPLFLSGLGPKVVLAPLNKLRSFPISWASLCQNWYFFLNCLVEFTSEAVWVCSFFCGKVFNYKFNFFTRYRAI